MSFPVFDTGWSVPSSSSTPPCTVNLFTLQAELTAGINHTSMHEGYLPIIQILSSHCCHVLMSGCEQLTGEQPNAAACDPEQLISHVRTCASVEAVKVSSCYVALLTSSSTQIVQSHVLRLARIVWHARHQSSRFKLNANGWTRCHSLGHAPM